MGSYQATWFDTYFYSKPGALSKPIAFSPEYLKTEILGGVASPPPSPPINLDSTHSRLILPPKISLFHLNQYLILRQPLIELLED